MSYLVPQAPATYNITIRRFEPAYWEVDFNLEAVATVVTTGPNSFLMKSLLRTSRDLIGLYWRSQDKWDHPLLSYEQKVDWTNCVLAFDLTYTNAPLIDDVIRPLVMTVTDMSGKPWYVYLKNFMTAGSQSSRTGSFSINFSTAKAGVLADETIPWNFIDSVFIGFTSPNFDKDAPQTPITELSVDATFTNISVSGTNSTVGLNNTPLAAHGLTLADGYADSYNLTPARVIDQIYNLGYRGKVILYVGFTQWTSLSWDAGLGRLQIDPAKPKINSPSNQWLTDYCTRLDTYGMAVVMSLSFELLNQWCPPDWMQRDFKNDESRSGWTPPSSFVSPMNTTGFQYLRDVAVAFVGIGVAAGCVTQFQVGEPWWWPGGFNDNGPCFYDAATIAAYTTQTGLPVPTPYIRTIYDDYSSPAQNAYVTWLGQKLGQKTLELRDVVKAAYPGTLCTVLFYTPTVTNPLSPMMQVVNFPSTSWYSPAWDFIQVEDYEVIEYGNFIQQEADLDAPVQSLGYPLNKCEYFSGFNLLRQTTFIWDNIDKAIWVALEKKGYSTALVWARPQVCLDGWVYNEDDWATYASLVAAPSLPVFPDLDERAWNVGRRPQFNTLTSIHASGKEIRSPRSVYPRWTFSVVYEILRSDVPTGAFQQLFSFFQSRKGRGQKFFFNDPKNNTATSQFIGTGTGFRTVFALVRSVGTYEEPIGALNTLTEVRINGVVQNPSSYSVYYNDQWPSIKFDVPPAASAVITATYTYYFVCRFVNDTQDFEEFMSNLHSLNGLQMITVKP